MKIYLGGKIAKNDWRSKLLNHRARDSEGRIDRSMPTPRWRVLEKSIFGEHDCTGPFFISCDHGCAHGDNTHGVGAGYEEPAGYASHRFGDGENHRDYICTDETTPSRLTTYLLCRLAICGSDLMFVWLDDASAYGTFVEIGMASAFGVPTRIAVPHDFNTSDMWFAGQAAYGLVGEQRRFIVANTPEDGLRRVLSNKKDMDVIQGRLNNNQNIKRAVLLMWFCVANNIRIVWRNGRYEAVGEPVHPALKIEFEETQADIIRLSDEIENIMSVIDAPPKRLANDTRYSKFEIPAFLRQRK